MPELFKPTFTDKKTGAIRETKYWYTRIAGRRYPLRVTDKRVAERKANELLRQIENGDDPDQIRNALHEDIENHLRAFELSLKAKGCCAGHIALLFSRIRKVFEACGIVRLVDVKPHRIEEWLVQQQIETGMSAQTKKHYCVHLRQLGSFLLARGLATKNPFMALRTDVNVEADRRLRRRSLTLDEFRKLLESVSRSKKKRCKLTGPERRLLYWIAGVTGLRRGELGTLTKESFSLASEPPTVTVTARWTKNRKTAVLPLRADLASELEPWLARKAASRILFPIGSRPTNLMIRQDLLEAGIEPEILGKRVDFHSLRVTMISHLAINGVPLAVAQKLARHSTPVLTANVYTHLGMADLKRAVESLPSIKDLSPAGASITAHADPECE